METVFKQIDNWIIDENKKKKPYVLFGAGQMAVTFLKLSNLSEKIVAIADNDNRKVNEKIGDIPVCVPDECIGENMFVIITSLADKEIGQQIESKWPGTEWVSLPFLLTLEEIHEKRKHLDIKSVMIEATNYCNAQCSFCSNPRLKRKKQHMSQDIFNLVVQRLCEAKIEPERFWLHCLGEPLLDPNLFEKVHILKNKFPNSWVGYTSNFSIASDTIIQNILNSGQDYIIISLNAIEPDEYKKIMGLDYEKTIRNIKRLIEEKSKCLSEIKITISFVDTYKDQKMIDNFLKIWKDYDVEVRILREGEWIEDSISYIDCDETKKIRHISRAVCGQLYEEICVLSNGDYALCCFDAEGALDGASVYNMSIEEAVRIPKKINLCNAMLYLGKTNGICENCSFRRG